MILFAYILMCLIFGTTFLVIKVGLDAGAPPFFTAGIRFLLAGLLLFAWMVWRRKASFSLLFHKEMILTGAGLTFGTFAGLYWAEQHISSGIAAVLSATGPLLILLLQLGMYRQRVSRTSLIGCLIGFAGVILLLMPSMHADMHGYWLLGCLAVLAGELCYAFGAVYSKRVIQRFHDTSPIAQNAVQMMYGGAMLLLLSLGTEQVSLSDLLAPQAISSLLYLTIAGSMMGHTIFYWLVAKTNPVFPSTWLYVSPLIALSLGVFLYNETVPLASLLGGITIILGILLVNLENLRQLAGKHLTGARPARK